MASDDECYYFDDDEDGVEAGWDGVAMEADEEDVGLLEEASPLPERRADCWVSGAAGRQGGLARRWIGYACIIGASASLGSGWSWLIDLSLPLLPILSPTNLSSNPSPVLVEICFFFKRLILRLWILRRESVVSSSFSDALIPRSHFGVGVMSLEILTRSASDGMRWDWYRLMPTGFRIPMW